MPTCTNTVKQTQEAWKIVQRCGKPGQSLSSLLLGLTKWYVNPSRQQQLSHDEDEKPREHETKKTKIGTTTIIRTIITTRKKNKNKDKNTDRANNNCTKQE